MEQLNNSRLTAPGIVAIITLYSNKMAKRSKPPFAPTEKEAVVESLSGETELKSFGGNAEEIPPGRLDRHG